MTDSGVVDPIRIPPWLRTGAERAWRETPPIARLFIGLAFVDVIARGIGFLQPRVNVGFDVVGVYTMLVPHDLWILLPAVLVLRRRDAATTTPRIFAGAVLLALVTLLARPIEGLASGGDTLMASIVIVGILHNALDAAGWLLLATGLARLNPRVPSLTVAGLSNLVIGLGLLGIVLSAGREILGPAFTTGDAGLDSLVRLGNLVAYVSPVSWLYLLWIVIRGVGDSSRPTVALTTAAVGATISGFLGASAMIADNVIMAAQPSSEFWATHYLPDVINALGFVEMGVGTALVLVAFALGLAEPPFPPASTSPPSSAPPVTAPAEPAAEASEAATQA